MLSHCSSFRRGKSQHVLFSKLHFYAAVQCVTPVTRCTHPSPPPIAHARCGLPAPPLGTTCTAAPLGTVNGKSGTIIAFSSSSLSANASNAPFFDDQSILTSDRPSINDHNLHLAEIHPHSSPPFADPRVAGRDHTNSPYFSPANIQPEKHSTEGTAPSTQTKSLHKAPSLEVQRHSNHTNVLSVVPEPSNSKSGVPETACGGEGGILGSTEDTNQGTKWKLDNRNRRSPSFNSVVHEKWGSVFVVGGGQRRRRPPVRNRSTGLDDTPTARKAQVM